MKERDTIWRYLFRKSGFGRTGWVEFAVIAMAVVMVGGYAIIGEDTASRIACGAFALGITAVMVWGTAKNYREDNP